MKIIKSNGKEEDVKFDKISSRIKKLTYGLDSKFVDSDRVSKKVIDGLYDGVTSRELDQLAAETAAGMTSIHPDYSLLASRLAITSFYKDTDKSFSKTVKKLYNYIDPKTGKKAGLIGEGTYKTIMDNAAAFDSAIVHDRDFLHDYFGFRTLYNAYLLRMNEIPMERIQHMWMRVAVGIWGEDIEGAIKLYNRMSQKYMTHATPTLFNAGTRKPQMSSCFLLGNKGDSIDGIYDTLHDVAMISKHAGGIGVHIHDVRARGSYIRGTNGISEGIIPMLKVYNETARYVNQAGKRKGSFAFYLEPWHADVFDFLDLRKTHGKEEMRARDLFTALWCPDLFFKRVEEGGQWSLMCPDKSPGLSDVYGDEFVALYEQYESEGRAIRVVKAQELWDKITESQIESGTPYMAAKDAGNQKSNQKNIGIIKSSNLCVAPETQIFTEYGYETISVLENQVVKAWNGEEFSEVTVVKTSEAEKLLTVTMSNGQTIDATGHHKWYIQSGYKSGTGANKLIITEKRTHELVAGDKLVKLKTPIVEFKAEMVDAYTQGFFSGDGCTYKGKNHIDLYGVKVGLMERLVGTPIGKYSVEHDKHRVSVSSEYIKFNVPNYFSVVSRLQWLAGLFDSDGCLLNNEGTQSIQVASTELRFLQEVHLMLQTLGVNSKITKGVPAGSRVLPDGRGGSAFFNCRETFRILIGADAIYNLVLQGLETFRLQIKSVKPNRNSEYFVKIVSVVDSGRIDATFCATESKRKRLTFNGVLTGNCIEIFEVSTAEEQAVCNLASMAVCMYYVPGVGMDYQALYDDAYLLTLSLNKVIDVNYYPTPETKLSNMRHRPIAIGLQGLADLFAMAKVAFESPEAADLNKKIYETMAFASITASKDLAKVDGPYETYEGSPISQGIFQFNMWKDITVKPVKGKLTITEQQSIQLSGMWDWDALRKEIMEHGVRNSLNISQMPTASCQTVDTEIITNFGVKSYREILVENGVDVEAKELGIEQHWITLKTPVSVQTMNGFVETNQIFYNGYHEVFELEMEDGTIFEATANHKFLVNRESGQTWVRVDELQENDNIVNIFEDK